MATCDIDGCAKPARVRGWCSKHYLRWTKYGDPLATRKRVRGTCLIEGCGKPHDSRGWCTMHYARWLNHGDPLALLKPRAYNGQLCSVEACGRDARNKGYCSMHYQRWRNNGDPLTERRSGSRNTSWRGPDADISSMHQRVYRARGKADHCSRCGRSDDGICYDWANLTGNYGDIWDYEQMCRSCHRKYDKHGVGEKNNHAVLTETLVREIRARHAAGERVAPMATYYGVAASSLWRAISGKTWAHVI